MRKVIFLLLVLGCNVYEPPESHTITEAPTPVYVGRKYFFYARDNYLSGPIWKSGTPPCVLFPNPPRPEHPLYAEVNSQYQWRFETLDYTCGGGMNYSFTGQTVYVLITWGNVARPLAFFSSQPSNPGNYDYALRLRLGPTDMICEKWNMPVGGWVAF